MSVINKPMVNVPLDELERTINVLRYAAHPYPSPHADYWEGYLAKPATQHQAAPVVWTHNKPEVAGAYWVRGNGLDQAALIQIVDDAEGLLCNLHQRTSESDFGFWYAVSDLSDSFEWSGPLYAR